MTRYFKHDLNILGQRRIFFTISLILIILSIGGLAFRGLNLGIEFSGGTSITFLNTGEITIEEMRTACDEAGLESPVIQTTNNGTDNGFIVRAAESDPNEAASEALAIAESLSLPDTSYDIQTIDAAWGPSIMRTSVVAFLIAIVILIVYISIRFEWKMSLTAILSLVHDLVIVLGIYALFGLEFTPNVMAAILTITGYSLYDTVVSFHRIDENASPKMHHSYMTVANHSVNQVLARTINTTLTSLIPVLAMLFFGGATLKDFALAMALGLILGGYSSFGIAVPIFALWKSRELTYAKLAVKYGEGVDDFSDELLLDTSLIHDPSRIYEMPEDDEDRRSKRREKREKKREERERAREEKRAEDDQAAEPEAAEDDAEEPEEAAEED